MIAHQRKDKNNMGLDHSFALYDADVLDTVSDDDVELPDGATLHRISMRKQNEIHGWVVDHINNGEDPGCWTAEMSLEQLAGLDQTIREIIDLADNGGDWQTLAAETLPTRSGFFFGPTAYDDDYLEYARLTTSRIAELLAVAEANSDKRLRLEYWCWW